MTGELAKSPSVTSIWLDVPRICRVDTVVGLVSARAPVPVAPATARATPVSANVGLPATPSPLATDRPVVVEDIVLAATALLAVLAIMPLEAASRLPEAAFRVMVRVDCAPASTSPTPVPLDSARLLLSVGSWFFVRKVWVCTGDPASAAVVVCTVTPFWTIGTDSVPVIAPAAGSSVIVTFAITAPGRWSRCRGSRCSLGSACSVLATGQTGCCRWSRSRSGPWRC